MTFLIAYFIVYSNCTFIITMEKFKWIGFIIYTAGSRL